MAQVNRVELVSRIAEDMWKVKSRFVCKLAPA